MLCRIDTTNKVLYYNGSIRTREDMQRIIDWFSELEQMDDPIIIHRIDQWTYLIEQGWTVMTKERRFIGRIGFKMSKEELKDRI